MRRFQTAVAAALFTFVFVAAPMVRADESPTPEQLQKLLSQRTRLLEDKIRDLTDRVAKLEAQIAAVAEGPERERIAAELKIASKDVATAKDDMRYYKALERVEASKKAMTKSDEIKDRAEKTASAEEKAELLQEAAELRRKAKAADDDATRLMKELAPLDRAGYGRAHLWLVQQLYRFQKGPDGKTTPPSPRDLVDAERHLIHALSWSSDDVVVGAHFGLAKLYRDTNRIDESKKHLLEVAKRHPEYRLTLAQWAKQQNEAKEEIVGHALAAEEAFRARLKSKVDDHEARFGLVECLMLQDQFEEAQATINKGATLATQADVIRAYARKLTWVLIQWSDAKEKDPKDTLAERLNLLDQALSLDPDNPELFNRLMKMTKDKSPEAEKARAVFRRLSSSGPGSPMAHLFLGIDAYQNDKHDEARHHWEKAFKLSEGSPLIGNNLAWILAFSEPFDLPRALELINAALAKQPDEPRFRGTRGHILFKMGKHKEALPDLQEGIKAYPNDLKLFRALAETCRKLGLPKLAEEYEKKAAELEKAGAPAGGEIPAKRPGDI